MYGELYCPIWLKIFATIVLVTETILGVCLNMSVLLTPISKKHLHGNFFVKDLATANLFVSACIPPLITVVVLLPVFKFHVFVIVEGLLCFSIVSNSASVTCISIDRYVSIVKLDKMDRNILYPRTAIWFFSFLGLVLPLGAYSVLDSTDVQDCYLFKCRNILFVLKPYFLYEVYSTILFIVASFTVIPCYISVYNVAIKRIKIRMRLTNSNREILLGLLRLKRFQRVTKITACIIVSFLICWAPLIFLSWVPLFKSDRKTLAAHVISIMIAMLSNIFNPILYTFVRPQTQIKLKRKREVKVIRNSSRIAPHTTLVTRTSINMAKATQLLVPPSQDRISSSFSGSSDRFTNSDFHSTEAISVANITNHFDEEFELSQD